MFDLARRGAVTFLVGLVAVLVGFLVAAWRH